MTADRRNLRQWREAKCDATECGLRRLRFVTSLQASADLKQVRGRRPDPPRMKIDLAALAEMAATLLEGAIVLDRVLRDATLLPRQVLLYRDFVRAVCAPT